MEHPVYIIKNAQETRVLVAYPKSTQDLGVVFGKYVIKPPYLLILLL